VKTDLVLVPFDADLDDVLAAARAADRGGFETVWTYDHFSGLVAGAGWSRDPFVTLGAIAASTTRVDIGVLVANVANRHPAQLACAINTLQSLAPERVLLGIGAGAAPANRWSSEADAIDRPVDDGPARRALLAESIAALRAIWRGEAFYGDVVHAAAGMAVTDGAQIPPIIVGGRGEATIAVACAHADGVNLNAGGEDVASLISFVKRQPTADAFEMSVFGPLDLDHPLGGDPAPLADLGVARRTLFVAPPYPVERIIAIGAGLADSAREPISERT
jgi:alkanesulfonate monooxygenase SsuD/methylene tetrahydromethanopterin reductase-like flavin-dependent oxidoreductase (luciferase family)